MEIVQLVEASFVGLFIKAVNYYYHKSRRVLTARIENLKNERILKWVGAY